MVFDRGTSYDMDVQPMGLYAVSDGADGSQLQ